MRGWSADYRVRLGPEGCRCGVRIFDPEARGLGPADPEALREFIERGPEPLAACLDVLDYAMP